MTAATEITTVHGINTDAPRGVSDTITQAPAHGMAR